MKGMERKTVNVNTKEYKSTLYFPELNTRKFTKAKRIKKERNINHKIWHNHQVVSGKLTKTICNDLKKKRNSKENNNNEEETPRKKIQRTDSELEFQSKNTEQKAEADLIGEEGTLEIKLPNSREIVNIGCADYKYIFSSSQVNPQKMNISFILNC